MNWAKSVSGLLLPAVRPLSFAWFGPQRGRCSCCDEPAATPVEVDDCSLVCADVPVPNVVTFTGLENNGSGCNCEALNGTWILNQDLAGCAVRYNQTNLFCCGDLQYFRITLVIPQDPDGKFRYIRVTVIVIPSATFEGINCNSCTRIEWRYYPTVEDPNCAGRELPLYNDREAACVPCGIGTDPTCVLSYV